MNRIVFGISLAAGLVTPLCAYAQEGKASSTGAMTSNGSSTGVGNAGSFGIGSGTSDSLSTATAISNGVQDSSIHTDNSARTSSDSSTKIDTVSLQDLKASNSNNQITINAGANPGTSPTPASSNTVSGSAFSGYSGILTNSWNTGPSGASQAGTNIAVNGNFRPN